LVELAHPDHVAIWYHVDGEVFDLWFDPLSKRLASTLNNGKAILIQVDSPALHYIQYEELQFSRGVFSPDGSELYLASDVGRAFVYRTRDVTLIRERAIHAGYFEFRDSESDDKFLTVGVDGKVSHLSNGLQYQDWQITGIQGQMPYILGPTVRDGLLSLYMVSGEWLTYDIGTNRLLSRFNLPFQMGPFVSTPRGTDAFLMVTADGNLVRGLRWPPALGDPQCENPYVVGTSGELTLERQRLGCPFE
jgi:hypothetical protein